MDTTVFLTLEQVLRLHERSIEHFGGSQGIRDRGALESAIAQPEMGFSGVHVHESIYDKAAAYLFHVVKNHPFIDGNKRTGFGCAEVFLRLNGHPLLPEHRNALTDLVLDVASGASLSKQDIAMSLMNWTVHYP